MLRCVQFVELVTPVEERAVGPRLRLELQVHRVVCRHCRRYLRQMRAVSGALQEAASGDSPRLRSAAT